jgi:alkylation response protein AidB-like acyl-CoA dehydrogenase
MQPNPNLNRVLAPSARASANFWHSDRILQHFLTQAAGLSPDALAYMLPRWQRTGERAACEMDALSLLADKHGPVLQKRDFYGNDIDRIVFHPAYQQLLEIAVESEMFRVKWLPELRERFAGQTHTLGFGAGYLYALAESGQYCPLCMTDGAARLVDRYCTPQDRNRLLPHIWTSDARSLFTGAMFLTEKAGGSDVGANLVEATHLAGDQWLLNGEKWFCSNANAEIIFALARTQPHTPGTRGLGIFLIEPTRPDNSPNPRTVIRLKDKLGVRSMASAEIMLSNTQATLVGGPTDGFKIMTDMINLSRLYNSVAALGVGRRALALVWEYLNFRTTFGKPALQHALIRHKLHELGALHVANFYLTWEAIRLLDAADAGDQAAAHRVRLVTPMVKKWSAETGVYLCRESMELMGGLGYIEDGIMPKLLRDALVLPIWEGAGNIMTLDMLRAAYKSQGLSLLLEELNSSALITDPTYKQALNELELTWGKMSCMEQDEVELTAKGFFARLTALYQCHLVARHLGPETQAWAQPALAWLLASLANRPLPLLSVPQVAGLVAWEF